MKFYIVDGMSEEMIVESLGDPTKKDTTTFKGKPAEIWRYPDGYNIEIQKGKVVSVQKNSYYW